MLTDIPPLPPPTTSVVPVIETADELVTVEVCSPPVWTEVEAVGGELLLLLRLLLLLLLPPMTNVPLASRETSMPETVTAGPPGLRVVPATEIAVGFVVKV